MDFRKLASDIIRNVGGNENINSVIHCVTRLRFSLKDHSLANTDKIKEMDGVITVVISGGQYQVVIGNQVKDAFNEVINILGNSYSGNGGEAAETKKKNAFNRFIDVIIGIISPMMGLLAASGILKGLLGASTALHWLQATDGTYILLNALGDGLFYFLPIMVGFSAGKKFNANPYIPAAIGAALVYPAVVAAVSAGKALTFAGIPIILTNYTSSLFPIIMAAWVAAKIEKWLEKKLPSSLKLIFVPLITMVVTGILTFLAVGPVLNEFSSLLANITMGIYHLSPIIAGVILGAFWQLVVIFGLHYAFLPVLINNMTTLHYDPVNAILTVTVFAQVGAALGVFLKAKNKKVRGIAGSATVSALLGITEPAIYGISLPYKKPFVMAGIAGGIGGGITAAMGAKMFGFGGTGIFATPMFINPKGIDSSFYGFLISALVAVIGAALLTYLFGYKDKAQTKNLESNENKENKDNLNIYNTIQGAIIPLSEVKDDVFSSGAMGNGFAVIPDDNKVYAPFDGKVLSVFSTKHAIGLISNDGVELLIHMGINTVELNGSPFDIKVKENQVIKKGQLIAEVNWKLVSTKNYDITTPIIVTNTADYQSVILKVDKNKKVNMGELVLTVN
ncbi:beta-glucoside-specific PTS transporter subunit IIABC [Neobacillus cucumis]|uniref:beta-glucoside-specific PTS transporter subunit IIABC n=1 Tax=Neobacillus cucumis TaxID=1740721 RepID=UPI002E1A5F2B|nr:beta-glucoside-specific PTS transporter subunit IIABC [Neobacillus cucumis]MED4224346.1 beta-glucoside-specific PTS transporter subunit IIABC [Neobacillus cucumis]